MWLLFRTAPPSPRSTVRGLQPEQITAPSGTPRQVEEGNRDGPLFMCGACLQSRDRPDNAKLWQDPTGRPARPAVTDAVGRGIRAKLGLVVAASLSLHSCSCWLRACNSLLRVEKFPARSSREFWRRGSLKLGSMTQQAPSPFVRFVVRAVRSVRIRQRSTREPNRAAADNGLQHGCRERS